MPTTLFPDRLRRLGRQPIVWLAVHVGLTVWLAGTLAPDAWFVGDPGIKLIAARSALAHPSRPLETELPPVLPDEADAYRQPFFVPHGDHAHAITSPLFPLLTAPLLAAAGLRGIYVLPALGWMLIAPLTLRLACQLGARASPVVLSFCAIGATPFLFYGLEFWEHAPAVAAMLGAACLMFHERPTVARSCAAGVAGAIGVMLRPEIGWSLAAIALASGIHRQSGWLVVPFAFGIAVGLLPLVAYNALHFGNLSGPHVTGNVAGLSENWLRTRAGFLSQWLAPHRLSSWIAVAVILAAHLLMLRKGWLRIGLAVSSLAIVWLALEMARGHEVRESFWRAFPLALLAFVPGVPATRARQTAVLLVMIPLVGVLLTAPNDGGGQWGPRYLLAVVPMFLILVLDMVATLAERTRLFVVVAAFLILCGLFVSRSAWIELRAAKAFYATTVHDTAAEFGGAAVVLTDVWWFGQVHASILGPQQVLFVDAPSKATARLAAFAPADVLLVRSSQTAPGRVEQWTQGTCYTARSERRSGNGQLRYARLSCKEP